MGRLFIKNIQISHFRSHKFSNIDLAEGPIVLCGLNGVGKTNILEAISLFSPGRGLRRSTALELRRFPENLGWKVSAKILKLNNVHEVSISSQETLSRLVEIDGDKTTQLNLGNIVRMLWITPFMDRLWLDGATERRRFLDRLVLSVDNSHGKNSLIYNKAMKQRNRLIKDNINDEVWLGVLEDQMAISGYKIDLARQLALQRIVEFQKSFESGFPVANLKLLNANLGSVDQFRIALEKNRPADFRAGRSLIGPHKTDLIAIFENKGIEAKYCSTGEQKALMISIVLASARIQKADLSTPPILLLDEVSAHLDSSRRSLLYEEICSLGAQVLFTGTDLNIFDDLKERAQCFSVDVSSNETILVDI